MTEQERSLLGGCLKGKKIAWDELVRQYSGLVYYTIRRTLRQYQVEPTSEVVDDLFQNFFISLMQNDFRKLRQFRAERGTRLATWLRVIVCRQTIDFLRKQKVSTTYVDDLQAAQEAEPITTLLDKEQSRLLSQSLENLQPRDRLFVELYFFRGRSHEEIANILRVSTNGVYTQKHRVLKKLRESLKKAGLL